MNFHSSTLESFEIRHGIGHTVCNWDEAAHPKDRPRTASDSGTPRGGIRDAQPDRSLLEQYRDGTHRRGGAGSGDGWIDRRVSVAVSVQAYAGWMGQRRHRLAVGGAAHVLEALRGNPPPQ